MKKVEKLVFPNNLKWFLGTMILANIGAAMAYPLMPIYINERLGASITEVGLVFTLASIVPILLQIISGYVSDMIGRLPTIAIGAVIACAGYIRLDWNGFDPETALRTGYHSFPYSHLHIHTICHHY